MREITTLTSSKPVNLFELLSKLMEKEESLSIIGLANNKVVIMKMGEEEQ